jgi:UDP-N-acetylmuramoyl-tripeptide--D-alanyl-D-alanine ligase
MTALYELYLKHPSISTDTRRIAPDSLFFALRGASFDGNRFAADALAKGAVAAIVDDPSVAVDERYIVVEDTLRALQELAHEHRTALGIPILAIAGSNGKTTTKELISRVLAEKFRIYATRGNLNNHIGVPLTLLAMTSETEFGIVEMGASACGEIARLCEIADPDFGILTNVGRAHLEGFGGEEGVRRGKGELYDYLAQYEGVAFLREEDETLRSMAEERTTLQAEYYSEREAEGIEHHLEGIYNRYNVAAAAAIGRYFCIEEEATRRAIGSYLPDNNRSQREERATNTLIIDCYNANPSSMQASIENFLAEPLGERKERVLVLGDMRELGRWSEEEHLRIIRLAECDTTARVIFVGEEFGKAIETIQDDVKREHYATCEALYQALQEQRLTDSLILIKASRGIGLERIIELL